MSAHVKAAKIPECLHDVAAELPLTLSRTQAAEVLNMSCRTLDRCIERGEIRAIKSSTGRGARVTVPRAEVLRWMSERVI